MSRRPEITVSWLHYMGNPVRMEQELSSLEQKEYVRRYSDKVRRTEAISKFAEDVYNPRGGGLGTYKDKRLGRERRVDDEHLSSEDADKIRAWDRQDAMRLEFKVALQKWEADPSMEPSAEIVAEVRKWERREKRSFTAGWFNDQIELINKALPTGSRAWRDMIADHAYFVVDTGVSVNNPKVPPQRVYIFPCLPSRDMPPASEEWVVLYNLVAQLRDNDNIPAGTTPIEAFECFVQQDNQWATPLKGHK